MAKTRGPLLSMRASGQIGSSHVYGTWRGVAYARQLVTPTNPRTTDQTQTRSVFAWLQACYRELDAAIVNIWRATAAGQPLTDRNAFTKHNLADMRVDTDLASLTLSAGTGNAPAPVNVSFATGPAGGKITFAADAPPLPTGWTNGPWYATAIVDQDPHDTFEGPVVFAQYPAGPNFSDHITVPLANTTYSCGVIHAYTDDRGRTVYSADVRGTATSST